MAVALAAESSACSSSLAGLTAVVGAPVRPATLSLVPLLARTPRELVATNVSSSTLEGLGTLVGRRSAASCRDGRSRLPSLPPPPSTWRALSSSRASDARGMSPARGGVERSLRHELSAAPALA